MAAGLGFKTFNTGDVLSAADVNGYLMQGVLVFADATARDAAITSPQEGQFAFLKDTNVTTYYTGSAWANLDTTGMTNPMTTTGDTIYSSSGSTPARLGIGTAGQVLQVNSGATAPEWATPAGGGGMTLLSTTTLSGSSTSVTGISSSYKDLRILLYGVNASSGGTLTIQLNGSNSVSYTNQVMRLTTAPILEQLYAGNWRLNGNGLGSASASNCFALTVSNYANDGGSTVKPYFYFGGYTDDGPRSSPIFGGGYWEDTTAVSSFNVAIAAGTFSAGTIKVYGVK
jgi:hypothetical protein